MRHHLLLLLGTGGYVSDSGGFLAPETALERPLHARRYRVAHYARAEDLPGAGAHAAPVPATVADVATPFVGEALLRLHPGRFTDIHVFGTADVMWNQLHGHLLQRLDRSDLDDLEAQDAFDALVSSPDLTTGHPLLKRLEDRFVEAFRAYGVRHCACHVLPLPTHDAALWESLRIVAGAVPADRARVSIDLTHGLRIQPYFLWLAAAFLQETRPTLEVCDAFYGALDLASNHPAPHLGHAAPRDNTVAPVYRVTALLDALRWLDAARAFRRYGDAAPVSARLKDAGDDRGLFADVAGAVQLNALADIGPRTQALLNAYGDPDAPDGPASVAFDLLRDDLMRLPRAVAGVAPWQAKAVLARHHARAQNLGLACIVAVEALVDRMAAAYGVADARRRTEAVAVRLRNAATGWSDAVNHHLRDVAFDTRVAGRTGRIQLLDAPRASPLPHIGGALNKIRNAIAHADERTNDAGAVVEAAHRLAREGFFQALPDLLDDPGWVSLPEHVPWASL